MNIVAILQARCSSRRFPNKVMKSLMGQPIIWQQYLRVKHARMINLLVLATSTDKTDDKLADFFIQKNEQVFRGSLINVLDRYYHCAKNYQADHIVRLTGDCPLVDPGLIDSVIDKHLTENNDYTTNGNSGFPYGLDVEVIRFSALKMVYERANKLSQCEHVTLYIRQHSADFKIGYLRAKKDLSFMRWVLDHPEDFDFIDKVYQALYPDNPIFDTLSIINFLNQHPHLLTINAHYKRDEGLIHSLVYDACV